MPDGDFCADLDDDWGLDPRPEPPSEEELHGVVCDPDNSPVEGWVVMSDAQRAELVGGDLYADEDGDGDVPEALEAGFTHRHGGSGAGFAAGGPLDVMLPGPELAWHASAARRRGLGVLSDDELVGVLAAAGRLESWSAGLKLAAVAELDARTAGHRRPGGLAGPDHDQPGRDRRLHPPARIRRIPALPLVTPPDQDPQPAVRIPRLPPPPARCDDDHTIPHHQGGKTCECNLYPLCRRHHQAKQAPGWHLAQPEPGTPTWTMPSGRTYTTKPEPYPA